MKVYYREHEMKVGDATVSFGFDPTCDGAARIFRLTYAGDNVQLINPHRDGLEELSPYYNMIFPSGEPMNAVCAGVSLRYNPLALSHLYRIDIREATQLCEAMTHSFSPEYTVRDYIEGTLSYRWRTELRVLSEKYNLVQVEYNSFDELVRIARDNDTGIVSDFTTVLDGDTFYRGQYFVGRRVHQTGEYQLGEYYLIFKAWLDGELFRAGMDKYASKEQAVKAMKQMVG
jgi:hypothetical protein